MVIQGVFKHTNQLALVGQIKTMKPNYQFWFIFRCSECLANHMNQTGSTFSSGFQIKTLLLKLEWKSKTNLSITVTIKATDHLRYLRICPDEIIYCSHSFKIPWRNISFTNFCETKYEQIDTVCTSNIPRTIFLQSMQ
jgi:hypothetical protein